MVEQPSCNPGFPTWGQLPCPGSTYEISSASSARNTSSTIVSLFSFSRSEIWLDTVSGRGRKEMYQSELFIISWVHYRETFNEKVFSFNHLLYILLIWNIIYTCIHTIFLECEGIIIKEVVVLILKWSLMPDSLFSFLLKDLHLRMSIMFI